MSIGENIKKIRKERKLTQDELAKSMGISRSYLSDIENNRKNPSSKTIESLAEKLGVTMAYLLEGKKTPDNLSDEEIEAFENYVSKLINGVPTDIRNRFESIDFDTLEGGKILFLKSALEFLELYPEELVSDFYPIFSSLNRLLLILNNEIEAQENEKEKFTELTLELFSDISDEIKNKLVLIFQEKLKVN